MPWRSGRPFTVRGMVVVAAGRAAAGGRGACLVSTDGASDDRLSRTTRKNRNSVRRATAARFEHGAEGEIKQASGFGLRASGFGLPNNSAACRERAGPEPVAWSP